MNQEIKLGVVLLAAGRSARFGSNKLLADLGGRPLVCRALETVCAISSAKACIVTGSREVSALARQYGLDVIRNEESELGQSHSIHLGVQAMREMDAVLLLVGDQPRLTAASLDRLVQAFELSGKGIACLRDETHMGNPAIFASRYYPELLALTGDRGAKGILKAYPGDLVLVDCIRAGELDDVDTPRALMEFSKESWKIMRKRI